MCFSNVSNYVRNKQINNSPWNPSVTFITVCFQLIILNSHSVGKLLNTSRFTEVVESLSLGIFKTWLDTALGNPLQLWSQPFFEQELQQDDLEIFYSNWIFHESMKITVNQITQWHCCMLDYKGKEFSR